MRVYIAGAVTDDPHHRQKFAAAGHFVRMLGHIPVIPTNLNTDTVLFGEDPETGLPAGEFSHDEWMTLTHFLLERCEGIFVIPGSDGSRGTQEEIRWAKEHDLVFIQ